MIEFLSEYSLFLAKSVTIVLAIITVVAGIAVVSSRSKKDSKQGDIEVIHYNEELLEMKEALEDSILDSAQLKAMHKEEKKKEKEEKKALKKNPPKADAPRRKRLYVLDFDGDIKASEVEPLRQEISAVLLMAEKQDEVLIRLESPGGMVHEYGLASSQIERIKRKEIPLTICVDRVAASGGYMMACLADKLLAAPFAIVGSIGVIAQLPNFHKLLKKNDIDYEVLTAGEYKRTLTVFGENTDKGREKFVEELEETHELFKNFVHEYRQSVDINKVATGEIWFGKQALEVNLVDELKTSDEYMMDAANDADIFIVRYEEKKSFQEKISQLAVSSSDKVLLRWWGRLTQSKIWSR
ncbi:MULTISPECIES: protease SohB [unclassified Neptuniibacter]|uniref:protease SohB n=1 Tax=unclassified Neptuniibacter TaxID=2630693 RepID=UPI0025EF2276|nr:MULTISPECIES: protease SohB [unclassified Neptuniibacter]